MKTTAKILFVALFMILICTRVFSQTEPLDEPGLVPAISLSGPRLGFTVISGGDLAANVSLAGASFAFAAGVTARSGPVNFPINLAFVPSTRGGRISLLFGFNTRRK